MPPELLASQFASLEPPGPDEPTIRVSIDATVDAIVDDIVRARLATRRDQRVILVGAGFDTRAFRLDGAKAPS